MTELRRRHMPDRMLKRGADIAPLLKDDNTHLFLCGLKAMDQGVLAALERICLDHGMDGGNPSHVMRENGHFHVETY